MTIRERVAAALRREPVDQVPFTTYRGAVVWTDEEERELRELGLGLSVRVPLVEVRRPNVEVAQHGYVEDGVRYRRTTIGTPVGEVHAVTRPGSAYGSDWAYEHYVKEPDDYAVMEYIIRDTTYVPAYDSFHREVEAVGEEGYVSGNMGYSPIMEMRVNLLGIERFSIDMHERPDLFFSLYETMKAKEREAYPILADSPAEVVIYCGNTSPEVLGRKRFEELCLPCYNELGGMLHERGKMLGSHMDANNSLWKDLVAGSELDIIEAFTPAPDTDMSVAEAREAWPEKVLWINFPSSVHLGTRERIQEATREMAAEAAGAERPGGFIVGITENVPDPAWRTSLGAIAEALAETAGG